jgi:hypothetical protein
MKTNFFGILLVAFLLAGCRNINVINHPKPVLHVDFSPFEKAGCISDEQNTYRCNAESELFILGCDQIKPPSEMLGGLSPALPIAVCFFLPLEHSELGNPYDLPKSEYFYNAGGLYPIYQRYVVYVNEEFRLIKNLEEFKIVFSPVEAENEALSFAIAAKRIFTAYDQKVIANFKYYVDTLEDSFVEKIEEGFIVHAFAYNYYGCGFHYTYALEVKVSKQGNVDEIGKTELFRDPAEDDLCRD